MNNRSILPDCDLLDRHSRHFRDHNAAKGIGKRGLDSDEIEHDLFVSLFVDFYVTILLEVLETRRVQLADFRGEGSGMFEGGRIVDTMEPDASTVLLVIVIVRDLGLHLDVLLLWRLGAFA